MHLSIIFEILMCYLAYSICNLLFPSSGYELFAFISHMGASTMSGHYVCHIKKEGRWVEHSSTALYSVLKEVTLSDISDCFPQIFSLSVGGWSTTTTKCVCQKGLQKTWATSTFTIDCLAVKPNLPPTSTMQRSKEPQSFTLRTGRQLGRWK